MIMMKTALRVRQSAFQFNTERTNTMKPKIEQTKSTGSDDVVPQTDQNVVVQTSRDPNTGQLITGGEKPVQEKEN